MKKIISIFALAVTLTLAGCNSAGSSTASTASTASTVSSVVNSTSGSAENSSAESGVWTSAEYTTDAEVGEGKNTVNIEVTADGKTVTLTVHSDNDNLEKILVENNLVAGDESEFGLYIKTVNGIRADYDLDNAYWALCKDGAPTATGASGITIADGDTYELVYTSANAVQPAA